MRRNLTKFQELPDDCTCNGEGLAPVSSVPRVGGLPELVTYECPVCGHVETVEKHHRKKHSRRSDCRAVVPSVMQPSTTVSSMSARSAA